ncbi:helix-turn-helix domain-containing protein [Cryobacterium sp. Hb1]|uniref:helix-turn-helix domain-containing protein n=1 Tax=Cryobacterium sp. Hb1 TaxID=1259147 RepID=UPI00141AEE29
MSFINAGSLIVVERVATSTRYFSQNDRIEIGDGLAAGEGVKGIAARIGKSFQSAYREIARNRKSDGSYRPSFAHAVKLAKRWSPGQVTRWLRRRYPRTLTWHICAETIYDGVYRGLTVVEMPVVGMPVVGMPVILLTRRKYRHHRGHGRSKDGYHSNRRCRSRSSG